MKRKLQVYCVGCQKFWTPDINRPGVRCANGHWLILRYFGWGKVPEPEEFGTSHLYNRPGTKMRIFTIDNYIQHPNDKPDDSMV